MPILRRKASILPRCLWRRAKPSDDSQWPGYRAAANESTTWRYDELQEPRRAAARQRRPGQSPAQLAERSEPVSGEASRIHQLAGRAARVATDRGVVQPVL